MKFLVDAQLPQKLALMFRHRGYDAIHTIDLPQKNFTTDSEINRFSVAHSRILISKDMDFVESLLLNGKPYKLLYINTGNISNRVLLSLFERHFDQILDALKQSRLVELTSDKLVIHE